jgi:A/G-specific adenine glycosylase
MAGRFTVARAHDPTDDLARVDVARLRRRLLSWYDRNARPLPWRGHPANPYVQWLAEMMLQQTQAATVIPYFERFLKAFPTVHDLASAPRDRVLALWAGLGYYRRAHALHEAARKVSTEHGGAFPDTVEGLLSLPGVGRYTAGAIASIAFDRRAPILDGNVARVLSRLYLIEAAPEDAATRRRLWALAEAILPSRRCGAFNQALMDLGATVCTPRSPRCADCPLAALCLAHREGATNRVPSPRRRAAVRELKLISFVIRTKELVLARRRPAGGLWSAMWELPTVTADGLSPQEAASAALPPRWRIPGERIRPAGTVEHQLTHRRVRVHVYVVTSARRTLPPSYYWMSQADIAALPRVFRKVLELPALREQ